MLKCRNADIFHFYIVVLIFTFLIKKKLSTLDKVLRHEKINITVVAKFF